MKVAFQVAIGLEGIKNCGISICTDETVAKVCGQPFERFQQDGSAKEMVSIAVHLVQLERGSALAIILVAKEQDRTGANGDKPARL